jgi:hypothetical protein
MHGAALFRKHGENCVSLPGFVASCVSIRLLRGGTSVDFRKCFWSDAAPAERPRAMEWTEQTPSTWFLHEEVQPAIRKG